MAVIDRHRILQLVSKCEEICVSIRQAIMILYYFGWGSGWDHEIYYFCYLS